MQVNNIKTNVYNKNLQTIYTNKTVSSKVYQDFIKDWVSEQTRDGTSAKTLFNRILNNYRKFNVSENGIDKFNKELKHNLQYCLQNGLLNDKIISDLTTEFKEFEFEDNKVKDENEKLISFKDWKINNSNKIQEYYESVFNTNIYKNLTCDPLTLSQLDVEFFEKLEKNKDMEGVFEQVYLNCKVSFSLFLTIILNKAIPSYFESLNNIINLIENNGSNDLKDQIIEYGCFDFVSNNFVSYNINNHSLYVCSSNKIIYIMFKHIELNNHYCSIPDLAILYKRWVKLSEGSISDFKNISNYNILKTNFEIKSETTLNNLLFRVARYLGIGVESYIKLLLKTNNKIYFSRSLNRIVKINSLNFLKNTNLQKLVELVWAEQVEEVNISIDGISLCNTNSIPWNLLFLQGSDEVLSRMFFEFKDNYVVHDILDLYNCLNGYTQPTKIAENTFPLSELKDIVVYTEIGTLQSEDTLLYSNNYCYINNCMFGFDNVKNQNKDINTIYFIDKTKSKIEILEEHKSRVFILLDQLKSGVKLKNKDIKYISWFFSYSSKNSFDRTNQKIRTTIEIINNNKQYRPFAEIIKLRYGGTSNIVCSLFNFIYIVKLSKTGLLILKDLPVWLIKDSKFIDICKKISDFVKSHNFYNGNRIYLPDFKNLQYIETFMGPLGSDGKNPKETVSPRIYHQHEKKLLTHFLGKDIHKANVEQLCEVVFRQYWSLVLDSYIASKTIKTYEGIYKFMASRQQFSTDSSSGGLTGKLSKNSKDTKLVQDTILKDFSPKQSTKKDAFESECTDFYVRSIFGPPITFCDMVMKQNERSKYRYIYSVTGGHYLVNCIGTYLFEPYLNKMGVNVVLNEMDVVTHNSLKVYVSNCIDFSEFNDQHEEKHKKLVYKTLEDEVRSRKLFGIHTEEFCLSLRWLNLACTNMMIRIGSDIRITYMHKGRLFSGERSTTLINSLMSVFYFILISVNCAIYKHYIGYKYGYQCINKEEQEVVDEITDLIKTSSHSGPLNGLSNKYKSIFKLCEINECLGDDGRSHLNSIENSNLFNEMAVHSGLILKLSKCLIGVGISEFLRRVEIKKSNTKFDIRNINYNQKELSLSVSTGYVCRAISSLVCGNPEGSDSKVYINWITQVYDGIKTIYVRSNYSTLFTILLEEMWKFISKLNQKNKEYSNEHLPFYLLYIPKSKNGLGLPHFDNLEYTINGKLPELPNPVLMMSTIKVDALKTTSIDYTVDNVNVQRVIKYGDVNEKKVMQRKRLERSNYIMSCTSNMALYSETFLERFNKYKTILRTNYSSKIEINKVESESSWLDGKPFFIWKNKFFEYIVCGQVNFKLITASIEKITNFYKDLDLLDLTKGQKNKIIDIVFGYGSALILEVSEYFYYNTSINSIVETAQYNTVFSLFLASNNITTLEGRDFKKIKNMFNTVLNELCNPYH